jgi:hypothetical protein
MGTVEDKQGPLKLRRNCRRNEGMAKDIICKRRGRENTQGPTEGEDYLMTMRKRTRSNSR